jgi:outer membrane lipoprotein-sorting protein
MLQLSRVLATAVTALAVSATSLTLPSVAGAQALPSATEIFDRHVKAIGGKEAIMAVSSVQQKGVLEIAAMGLSADVTMAIARPNKSSMIMTIPGLGEIRNGFDGQVAWDNNPMAGPSIAEGEMLEARKAAADFNQSFGIYNPADFDSISVVEKGMFGGEEAYKVAMKRKVGPLVHAFYSVATGLYIGTTTTVPTPMGNMDVNAVVGEYKTFGALKLPTKISQSQNGQDVNITLNDVTFNTVAGDAFNLPPEIKALVKTP